MTEEGSRVSACKTPIDTFKRYMPSVNGIWLANELLDELTCSVNFLRNANQKESQLPYEDYSSSLFNVQERG
jgi:hypothetical protein